MQLQHLVLRIFDVPASKLPLAFPRSLFSARASSRCSFQRGKNSLVGAALRETRVSRAPPFGSRRDPDAGRAFQGVHGQTCQGETQPSVAPSSPRLATFALTRTSVCTCHVRSIVLDIYLVASRARGLVRLSSTTSAALLPCYVA